MNELLRLEAVSFQVDRKLILKEVSLTLNAGECLGLVGPNGAGKTTLLRLVAGLLEPTSGQIWLEAQPLARLKRREVARRLGYVPQQAGLDFDFTIREVVLSGRNPYLSRFEVESEVDRQIATQALKLTDLEHLAERLVTTLSGGERQRVAIARALAQQPALLVLDEPTASLDLRHQHEIMQLVQRLTEMQGLAALISVHDLNLAARYCDRVAVLAAGQLVVINTPSEAFTPALLAQVFEVEAEITAASTHPEIVQVNVLGVQRN